MDSDRRRALRSFRDLLEASAPEASFQAFLAQHPEVLVAGLPIRLQPADVLPMGRPGRTEPDFLFFSKACAPVGCYGVIELKRPDHKIIQQPRRGLLMLGPSARLGAFQAQQYADNLQQYLPEVVASSVWMRTPARSFVLVGLDAELALYAREELMRVLGQLPRGVELVTYDSLYHHFSQTVPPAVSVLVPSSLVQVPECELRLSIGPAWPRPLGNPDAMSTYWTPGATLRQYKRGFAWKLNEYLEFIHPGSSRRDLEGSWFARTAQIFWAKGRAVSGETLDESSFAFVCKPESQIVPRYDWDSDLPEFPQRRRTPDDHEFAVLIRLGWPGHPAPKDAAGEILDWGWFAGGYLKGRSLDDDAPGPSIL